MRRSTIRCGVVLLAVGFVGMPSSRVNAQSEQRPKQIEVVSHPYGIARGEGVSISVVVYSNRTLSTNDPVIARIQLLDAEGDVIAQSDDMRLEPGKIRVWDVPRAQLPEGEPSGRLQVLTRILLTTQGGFASFPPVASTVELIDDATGRARVVWVKLRLRQRFPEGSSAD